MAKKMKVDPQVQTQVNNIVETILNFAKTDNGIDSSAIADGVYDALQAANDANPDDGIIEAFDELVEIFIMTQVPRKYPASDKLI